MGKTLHAGNRARKRHHGGKPRSAAEWASVNVSIILTEALKDWKCLESADVQFVKIVRGQPGY